MKIVQSKINSFDAWLNRQAGAWHSQKERQAPAWPLNGMFFIGYHLTAWVEGFRKTLLYSVFLLKF